VASARFLAYLNDRQPPGLRNVRGIMALRNAHCDECAGLWEAYENATFKQVRAENVFNRARAVYRDSGENQSLKRDVEKACQSAEQCYRALAQHRAIAHAGQSLARSATG
jgi:hypothetical protein